MAFISKKKIASTIAFVSLSTILLYAGESSQSNNIVASQEAEQRFEKLSKFVRDFGWKRAIRMMNGHVSNSRSENLEPRIAEFMQGSAQSTSITCVENGKIVASTNPSEISTKVDSQIQKNRLESLKKNSQRRAQLERNESRNDPDTSQQVDVAVEDHLIGKNALFNPKKTERIKNCIYCVITSIR